MYYRQSLITSGFREKGQHGLLYGRHPQLRLGQAFNGETFIEKLNYKQYDFREFEYIVHILYKCLNNWDM